MCFQPVFSPTSFFECLKRISQFRLTFFAQSIMAKNVKSANSQFLTKYARVNGFSASCFLRQGIEQSTKNSSTFLEQNHFEGSTIKFKSSKWLLHQVLCYWIKESIPKKNSTLGRTLEAAGKLLEGAGVFPHFLLKLEAIKTCEKICLHQ